MDKKYYSPEIEFVEFDDGNVIVASDCDFDCPENCTCHGCVGVCTWDCTSDDSTCTSADFNKSAAKRSSKNGGSTKSGPTNPVGFDQRFF